MSLQNDEGSSAATLKPSKSQIKTQVAAEKSVSKVARIGKHAPVTETTLLDPKQARRFVGAVVRRFDHPYAWLLSEETLLHESEDSPVCVLPPYGGCAGGLILGTLFFVIVFALLPDPSNEIERLAWRDRFNELHSDVFTFARQVLR